MVIIPKRFMEFKDHPDSVQYIISWEDRRENGEKIKKGERVSSQGALFDNVKVIFPKKAINLFFVNHHWYTIKYIQHAKDNKIRIIMMINVIWARSLCTFLKSFIMLDICWYSTIGLLIDHRVCWGFTRLSIITVFLVVFVKVAKKHKFETFKLPILL